MSATARRRTYRVRGIRVPRLRPRVCLAAVVIVAILVGGFLWVRQSSLVAVRRVTITGVSGPEASQIRAALAGAARGMSTLDLQPSRLRSAVAGYPVVRSLRLHASVPHGLRIAVVEQVPVAVILADGSRTTVAGDGTLLPGVRPSTALPTISTGVVPGGTYVPTSLQATVELLAAAPYALLAHIQSAAQRSDGLVATLRAGPQIVFGDESELSAKWRAAEAVLAAPSSAGASYIDVSDPARPAAGAGSDRAQTATTATTGSVAPTTSSVPTASSQTTESGISASSTG